MPSAPLPSSCRGASCRRRGVDEEHVTRAPPSQGDETASCLPMTTRSTAAMTPPSISFAIRCTREQQSRINEDRGGCAWLASVTLSLRDRPTLHLGVPLQSNPHVLGAKATGQSRLGDTLLGGGSCRNRGTLRATTTAQKLHVGHRDPPAHRIVPRRSRGQGRRRGRHEVEDGEAHSGGREPRVAILEGRQL